MPEDVEMNFGFINDPHRDHSDRGRVWHAIQNHVADKRKGEGHKNGSQQPVDKRTHDLPGNRA